MASSLASPAGAPPSRPMRPTLTREYIVGTALGVIDRAGIGGLSMRKLGAALGVDPMAVYHYLPNKAALFDGVVEAIYHEIDLDGMPQTAWREQAAWFMRRMRAVLRRHPNTLPIVSTRPVKSPALFAVLDRTLGRLFDAGLTAQFALDLVNCLAAFTMGHLIAEVGEPVGGESVPSPEALAALTPERFPNLCKTFDDGYEYRADEQFELGLQAMLGGFERSLTGGDRWPDTRRE